MDSGMTSAVAFGTLLRENEKAAHFYDHCTSAQRDAILMQVQNIHGEDQMKAFVERLPSAAL